MFSSSSEYDLALVCFAASLLSIAIPLLGLPNWLVGLLGLKTLVDLVACLYITRKYHLLLSLQVMFCGFNL
jgi:hypothetical protein